MKIAILSPVAWRTPPRHYGPWEQVASNIAEGLVKEGIDVTLFATADSVTQASLEAVIPSGYEEDKNQDAKVAECLHISSLLEKAHQFDLIHNHFDFLPLTYSGLVKTPFLTTIHGFSSPQILPVYQKYNRRTWYVSISDANRHPSLDYVRTVYNGVRTSDFRFNSRPHEYLLFLGRLHPDKGAYEAIQIALKARRKLLIAGIVQDRDYFKERVEPYLDEQIEFLGPAEPGRRNELLSHAAALLHPINFDEPFGMSVAESMLCGTPVIAFNRGSMPELIRHGETGFLVNNVDEAVESVGLLGQLDRNKCHLWSLAKFSQEKMVNDYMEVYRRILAA